MASSLDSLVKNLGKEKLYNVRRKFGGKTDLSEALISRKGVYPYDYMDCFDKFSEEKLPPKEHFFNRLKLVFLMKIMIMHEMSGRNLV